MLKTRIGESTRGNDPLQALASSPNKSALPKFLLGTALLAASVLSDGSAKAFTQITQPDAAYLSSTTLIDISSIPDTTVINSITDGTQTVSFGVQQVEKLQVGSGWSTWGSPPDTESSTPPILYTDSFTSLTLSLSNPSTIFGFELQPNPFSVSNFTVEYFDSTPSLLGSLSLSPNGSAGALLSAASDGNPFSRVVITSNSGADFAIAQVRYTSSVPGPIPVLGAASAFGFSRKLRKKIKARAQA
jgi:hypothetical protein